MEARVTLRPGQRGTRKLVDRFGEKLICARYRYDPAGRRRVTTVELIVDEAPWNPDAPAKELRRKPADAGKVVAVRLDFREEVLRQKVKAAGGR